MSFTIRPYEEGDFDAITALCLASWKSTGLPIAQTETQDYLRQLFSEKLARGSALHIAIAASKVVGFVSLYEDKVEQLFTAPSAQGAGVGKQILAFVKAQRPAGFWLTSLVENGGANRFYEREGMKRAELLGTKGMVSLFVMTGTVTREISPPHMGSISAAEAADHSHALAVTAAFTLYAIAVERIPGRKRPCQMPQSIGPR